MGVGLAIGAGLAGAGLGAYGASQTPESMGPWNVLRRNTWAQLNLLPELHAAQSLWGPLFQRQNISNYARSLFGGRLRQRVPEYSKGRIVGYHNVKLPKQQGLLDIANRAATRTLSNEFGRVAEFGPQTRTLLEGYNPEASGLLRTLSEQARGELEAGTNLSPYETRNIQQGIRGAQAARGLGYGNADAFQEAMRLALTGREAIAQRRAFAGDVANMNQSFYGDPFARVLGNQPAQMNPLAMRGEVPFNPIVPMGAFQPTNPTADAMMMGGGSLMSLGGGMLAGGGGGFGGFGGFGGGAGAPTVAPGQYGQGAGILKRGYY